MTIVQSMGVLNAATRLIITNAPSFNSLAKVGAGLLGAGLGYGISQELKDFIADNAPKMNMLLEEKRIIEEARVKHRARDRKGKVLYHYSDRGAVLSIGMYGVGNTSSGYKRGRPQAFYATKITPWSTEYTQEELSALFYGGDISQDVSWFAAIDGTSFIQYKPGHYEYFNPSNTGEVDLDVITIGPNLMLPQ